MNPMEPEQLKHIKQKKLLSKSFFLSILTIICLMLNGCTFRNGTYYEYLTNAPIITTDEGLARQKHIIAVKELNDTSYFYYTEVEFNQTKNRETAQKGYITVIKNLKNGKPQGIQVYLDGFGDTLLVNYYDKQHLDSLHISYYGNKKLKLYHEFKNGRKDGIAKYYYPNGNLKQITHWIENIEQGAYVSYYESGNVESKGNYNRGVKDSIWVQFNEQGDTVKVEHWTLGVLVD